jgi:AcrR family transcriptional regulator
MSHGAHRRENGAVGTADELTIVPRSRGRPSVKESDRIRRQIVAIATDEFVENGYERASMDRIAARAGSTKTTLYRLFASKDDLYKVALQSALAQAVGRLPELSAANDPEATLREFAGAMRASYREGRTSALWHSILTVRKQFPDLFRAITEVMRHETIASKLADYLEWATAKRILHVPRPDLAARHFTILVGPAQEWMIAGPEEASEEERIAEIIRLFVRGYSPMRGDPA